MGCIYKITNQVNGKVYIGQTSRDINTRWKEHLRHGFNPNNHEYNLHLYKSMRKYGKENFIIELVEQCCNELMRTRETFWIDFYNSSDPNYGYNLTLGGEGTRTINYEEVYKRYDDGESLAEISQNMEISRSNLTQILKCYKNYDPYVAWSRSKKYTSEKKGNAVCQYDLFGNLVATFPSSKSAEKSVEKTTHANIMKCCNNKRGLSGGFQWRFLNDPPPGEYVGPQPNIPKIIYQFDIEYNLICVFKSIGEASLKTGIDRSSISRCCNHDKNYKIVGGYIWRHENDLCEMGL